MGTGRWLSVTHAVVPQEQSQTKMDYVFREIQRSLSAFAAQTPADRSINRAAIG
jgi:hypothetical protein